MTLTHMDLIFMPWHPLPLYMLVFLLPLNGLTTSGCSNTGPENCTFARDVSKDHKRLFCGWHVDKNMRHKKDHGLRPLKNRTGHIESKETCSTTESDHCLLIGYEHSNVDTDNDVGDDDNDLNDDDDDDDPSNSGHLWLTVYLHQNESKTEIAKLSAVKQRDMVSFHTKSSFQIVIAAKWSVNNKNVFIREVSFLKGPCPGFSPASPFTSTAPTLQPHADETETTMTVSVVAAAAGVLVLVLSCFILLLRYRQNKLSCSRRKETQLSDSRQGQNLQEVNYELTEDTRTSEKPCVEDPAEGRMSDLRETSGYYSIVPMGDCDVAPKAPPHDESAPAASEVVGLYHTIEPDVNTQPLNVHSHSHHNDYNTLDFNAADMADVEDSKSEVSYPTVYDHLNEGTYNHIGEVAKPIKVLASSDYTHTSGYK